MYIIFYQKGNEIRKHVASDIQTAFLKFQNTIHVNAGYNLFPKKADRTRHQNIIVDQIDTKPMGLGHATILPYLAIIYHPIQFRVFSKNTTDNANNNFKCTAYSSSSVSKLIRTEVYFPSLEQIDQLTNSIDMLYDEETLIYCKVPTIITL